MGCRVIGNAKTTELFVGPINGPKRCGFNEFSSDVVGQIEGTKKPAGLAPCGLSGLHRMTLVITDGEFWWSWRELNPRQISRNSLISNILVRWRNAACRIRALL
ncbi:TPA: hypothetical protein MIO78_23440 [Klebsiella pneumoniae subsp. pneumoniae]|nr:hypothetical protein [Klebsiella pneumoniae subsp. pneumoniae]